MEEINQRSKSVCPRENYFLNKDKTSYQNSFSKTFFIQEKDKGDEYFRSTRVGSCRKVVIKNGLPLAFPYKIKNRRGEPLTNFNYTLRKIPKINSTYFGDYCTLKEENHIGMNKKPLVPYNPNHTRNKIINDFGIKFYRHLSSVNIGSEGLINRKQWISTYKDSFKPIRIKRISNPGILSDMAKRTHYKFNNIEFS